LLLSGGIGRQRLTRAAVLVINSSRDVVGADVPAPSADHRSSTPQCGECLNDHVDGYDLGGPGWTATAIGADGTVRQAIVETTGRVDADWWEQLAAAAHLEVPPPYRPELGQPV
jgi:hypothetical protein